MGRFGPCIRINQLDNFKKVQASPINIPQCLESRMDATETAHYP